jgi:hypothetical protein
MLRLVDWWESNIEWVWGGGGGGGGEVQYNFKTQVY